MHILRRLIAPIVLAALFAAVWALGLTNVLTWDNLARQQAVLNGWIAVHPLLAPILFLLFYIVSVTLSLPQAGLMTMTGGLLFGAALGGTLAVVAATIGAVNLFLIARSTFGEPMARRGGPALSKLREELRTNGFSYLLAMRLVPIVPFWLVNLAAPLCGTRLDHFVIATFIGIMPATFTLAAIGAGIGQILARGDTPNAYVLLSPSILLPLLALAVLSLMPVIWRKWRARDA